MLRAASLDDGGNKEAASDTASPPLPNNNNNNSSNNSNTNDIHSESSGCGCSRLSAIARQLAGITPLEDDEDDDSDNDGSGSSDDGSGNELTPCARDTAEGIVSREDDDSRSSSIVAASARSKYRSEPKNEFESSVQSLLPRTTIRTSRPSRPIRTIA